MMYKVTPDTTNFDTCVILAGGPSLSSTSLHPVQHPSHTVSVITINDSWKLAPGTRNGEGKVVHYFCDYPWWNKQLSKNDVVVGKDGKVTRFHDELYRGFWVTIDPSFRDHPQIHYLKNTGQRGLETDPTGLRHGSNSGFQAINLAYLLGAKKIILLGYDMRIVGDRTHWHQDSEINPASFDVALQKSFLPNFDSLADPLQEAGVEVVNCTPDSALKIWPYRPLIDALNPSAAAGVRTAAPGSTVD